MEPIGIDNFACDLLRFVFSRWPRYSLDPNPAENLGAIMKERVENVQW